MNLQQHKLWVEQNGDNTYLVNYPLNPHSTVIDIGGYNGTWAKQIYRKYNPNIIYIEPVPTFFNSFIKDLMTMGNHKITPFNFGVSTEQKDISLYVNGDATSAYLPNGQEVIIKCYPIEYFLTKVKSDHIDLIQVNIEGEEYDLLDHWIKTGFLNRVRYIQIQFHYIGENYEQRRENIIKGLNKLGFESRFSYPFVWEGFQNTNLL